MARRVVQALLYGRGMRTLLVMLLLAAACGTSNPIGVDLEPDAGDSEIDAGLTCANWGQVCGDSFCVDTASGPKCAIQACDCTGASAGCVQKTCASGEHCETRGSLPLVCVPDADGGA